MPFRTIFHPLRKILELIALEPPGFDSGFTKCLETKLRQVPWNAMKIMKKDDTSEEDVGTFDVGSEPYPLDALGLSRLWRAAMHPWRHPARFTSSVPFVT